MPERKLVVEIVGDSRSIERAFSKSTKSAGQFDKKMGQTFRGTLAGSGAFHALGRQVAFASGAFLGAAGFTAVARDAVEVASNLHEQQNKVAVVFGKSGKAVNEWGKTTAAAIGIANDQALEAAGTFGNLFRTVNLAPARNARLSKSLVKLAADMASFNNADPSDVLEALRSGLIGEAEPLRRFGVLLSETRVQQEALRETGKKTNKELTNQDKLIARYNLILKDTKPAQGDFARTQDGLANSSRQLRAELRDAEAAIGQAFLPVLAKTAGFLARNLPIAMAETGRAFRQARAELAPVVAEFRRDWPTIERVIQTSIRLALPYIRALAQEVRGMAQVVRGILHGDFAETWRGLKNLIAAPVNAAKAFLSQSARAYLRLGEAMGNALLNGLKTGLKSLTRLIESLVLLPINQLIDLVNKIKLPAFRVNTHIPGVGTIKTPSLDPIPTIPRLSLQGGATNVQVFIEGQEVRPRKVRTTPHGQTRGRNPGVPTSIGAFINP